MSKKKLLTILLVISLCMIQTAAFHHQEPVQAASKNKYWLAGVSVMAGGHMQMYYNESSMILEGKFNKSKTKKNVYNVKEKERHTSLKVAKNCKVITVEEPESQITSYREWSKNRSYGQGDEISFISAAILVKNNKIIRIYFSA